MSEFKPAVVQVNLPSGFLKDEYFLWYGIGHNYVLGEYAKLLTKAGVDCVSKPKVKQLKIVAELPSFNYRGTQYIVSTKLGIVSCATGAIVMPYEVYHNNGMARDLLNFSLDINSKMIESPDIVVKVGESLSEQHPGFVELLRDIRICEQSYDHYTQYIESFKQQEEAERHNDRLSKRHRECRYLILLMESLIRQLSVQHDIKFITFVDSSLTSPVQVVVVMDGKVYINDVSFDVDGKVSLA